MTSPDPVRSTPEKPKPKARFLHKARWWMVACAVIGLTTAAGALRYARFWQRTDPLAKIARTVVHRTDLGSTLIASGVTESSNNTVIECELERLDFSSSGNSISAGGASVIIDLIDEGTMVKKGDILCTLDSSDYEEIVRQQTIKTDQARAAMLQSRFDFDVSELAIREYTEGLAKQDLEILEGQIAFAESTLERSLDRMSWTSRMLEKGYASLAQRAVAERAVTQAGLDMLASKTELDLYKRFSKPKQLKLLEAEVEKRRVSKIVNEKRVVRMDDRLKYYQKMVDNCTIRAPHNGFLIYARNRRRSENDRIEPGATVRQGQDLFFIPDLDQMNVMTYLHESVAKRVEPGMAARVNLEGIRGGPLSARVVSVAPLPISASSGWLSSDEVRYFVAVVRLDAIPEGIRPSMTAEVEIAVDRREDVLTIPSEALAVLDGQGVCYVAGEGGLERRAVTIGRSTKDYLEVTSGLQEGEQIVSRPGRIDSLDALVSSSDLPEVEPSSTGTFSDGYSVGSASSVD